MKLPLWPPQSGFYKTRLVSGGPLCACRIWQGFGLDPETGEIREVCWMWRGSINGKEEPVDRVWLSCAGKSITEAEYDYLLAVHGHAKKWAPNMPEANPRQKIDLHNLPPVW